MEIPPLDMDAFIPMFFHIFLLRGFAACVFFINTWSKSMSNIKCSSFAIDCHVQTFTCDLLNFTVSSSTLKTIDFILAPGFTQQGP